MDIRTAAIATGVFVLAVSAFLMFVILYGSSASVAGPVGERADSPNEQIEAHVLNGFTIAFWVEGRPFVNYTDSVTGEVVKQDIFQALFWMAQTADDLTDVRTNHGAPIDAYEAAYRLGLVYEHGLFRYQRDPREAVRYYRLARVGGHIQGDAAATRLESAGH